MMKKMLYVLMSFSVLCSMELKEQQVSEFTPLNKEFANRLATLALAESFKGEKTHPIALSMVTLLTDDHAKLNDPDRAHATEKILNEVTNHPSHKRAMASVLKASRSLTTALTKLDTVETGLTIEVCQKEELNIRIPKSGCPKDLIALNPLQEDSSATVEGLMQAFHLLALRRQIRSDLLRNLVGADK